MRALIEAKACVAGGGISTCYASEYGATACLRVMVSAKADLTMTGWLGHNVTCRAAQYGHNSTLHFLLQAKADVNAGTPVLRAVQRGNVDAAQLLLKAKADIDASDQRGLIPLFAAAKNGHIGLVRLLLCAKANATKCSSDIGQSALFFAAARGHVAMVQCLLAHAPEVATVATRQTCNMLNKVVVAGSTPLDVALLFQRGEVVSLLVAATAIH